VFSTLIGGSSYEGPSDFVVDSDGRVYISGTIASEDIPSVNGLYPFVGGLRDAFVCRLSSNGDSLDFATPISGTGEDFSTGIAVDSSECIILAGTTESPNFPVTQTIGIISDPINVTDLNEGMFTMKLAPPGYEPIITQPSTPSPLPTTTSTPDDILSTAVLVSVGGSVVIIITMVFILRKKPM
jgi:hypothetical protein